MSDSPSQSCGAHKCLHHHDKVADMVDYVRFLILPFDVKDFELRCST